VRQGLPGRTPAFRTVLVQPGKNLRQGAGIQRCSIASNAAAAPTSAPRAFRWWITSVSPRAKSGPGKEKEAADLARERYEFRLAREEREKAEKAAKLAAKTAAGREKAAAALAEAEKPARRPEEDAKKALIAAALERAKAQKEQAHPENTGDLTPEQQAEVAAIEGRRAEIREMAKPHLRQDD
jgi:hypothetical protein